MKEREKMEKKVTIRKRRCGGKLRKRRGLEEVEEEKNGREEKLEECWQESGGKKGRKERETGRELAGGSEENKRKSKRLRNIKGC